VGNQGRQSQLAQLLRQPFRPLHGIHADDTPTRRQDRQERTHDGRAVAKQDSHRLVRPDAGGDDRPVDSFDPCRELAPAVPPALEFDGLPGRIDGQHLEDA